MSTRPQRPSRATYRRRRLVAVVVALLTLGLLAWGVAALVAALGGSEPETATPPDHVAEEQPGSEDPADEPDGELRPCTGDDLDVDVAMSPSEPAAGEGAGLELRLTNDGEQPCLLAADAPSVVVTILSGNDTVWSSTHCETDDTATLLLDSDVAHETTVRWPGTRSAAGCPADQPVANSGTYRLVVEVDGSPQDGPDGTVFSIG